MKRCTNLIAGVSFFAVAPAVYAQDAPAAAGYSDEVIIVEARRREETIQDVPLVVNAVTSQEIQKLNLRDFKEITSLVPGLQMANNANGQGTTSSIRGVNYDVNASGNNGTIEYYLNEAPASALSNALFQSMFDIGQIEVLRGPQGTLRGRSTPSGSITIAYRRPNLREAGGYMQGTVNDLHGFNVNGAINVPVIEDVFGIRIAGLAEEGRGNGVRSIINPRQPFTENQTGRVMARLTPTSFIELEGMYQVVDLQSRQFDHAASFSLFTPNALASPVLIRPGDRLSINDDFRDNTAKFDIFTWKASVGVAGQRLIYVGSHTDSHSTAYTPSDNANFFGANNFGQTVVTDSAAESHEVRLQNDERMFGSLDYVAGYFRQTLSGDVDLTQRTPVRLPNAFGGGLATIATTPIDRGSSSKEESYFGHLTYHLGDATEISGGIRHIRYRSQASLAVSGNLVPGAQENLKFSHTIYSASVKHNFSPDLMVYARFGSSWRPGINVVGDFSLRRSDLENSFLMLPPETSESYEIGLKTELLDRRLTFNFAAYQQDFKNYPYRSSSGVQFVEYRFINGAILPQVGRFNFVAPVPVRVRGFEAEAAFTPSERFSIAANLAYADGKIRNGLVPCNDLNGDGVPDVLTSTPTLDQLLAAVGSDNLSACRVTQRSGLGSPWSGNVRAEYNYPVVDGAEAFVRGLFSWNGSSQVDPANRFDDYGSYGLLNLYAGIRDPEGAWEVQFFAKNVTNDKTVLTVDNGPFQTNYQQLRVTGFQNGRPVLTPGAATADSPYTAVSTVARQEFGVNLRIAFGSR